MKYGRTKYKNTISKAMILDTNKNNAEYFENYIRNNSREIKRDLLESIVKDINLDYNVKIELNIKEEWMEGFLVGYSCIANIEEVSEELEVKFKTEGLSKFTGDLEKIQEEFKKLEYKWNDTRDS